MKGDYSGIVPTDSKEIHVIEVVLHVDQTDLARLLAQRAKYGYIDLEVKED
jgi:hypothetical protein